MAVAFPWGGGAFTGGVARRGKLWENIPQAPCCCQPDRIPPETRSMDTRPQLVLHAALRALRPLVRWLLRHGVTYTTLAAALKRVFLDEAQAELAARGMAATDSAITLLSGVHRRDVRQLLREAPPDKAGVPAAPGLVGEVVGRWMTERPWMDARGRPRALPRAGEQGFDALVAGISSDVRPRAMLDEMLRLGVVDEGEAGLTLRADGFAPRVGLAEMAALAAANLHDHAAAAVANLEGEADFLEQAVYVDGLSDASAERVGQRALAAWKQAMKPVLREAQQAWEKDQAAGAKATAASTAPRQRARFGVYFYREREQQ
jgi:Family of unknown function (DUF6502)